MVKLITKTDLEEFRNLCFDFGIELEDQVYDDETGQYTLKIDTPANRPDLLCTEGISLALKAFLDNENLQHTAKYKFISSNYEVIVKEQTEQIRPYIVCAVLKDVKMNQKVYKGLIDLQEKLHFNTSRKRTLVAIGVHDLDKLETPLTYDAIDPSLINFVPLDQTKEIKGTELMEFYKYLYLLENKPKYPVLMDAKNKIISLPPIINSDFTKVTTETRNLFIECTATDLNKAKTVLNTISMIFSMYSVQKNTIEKVNIKNALRENRIRGNIVTPVEEYNYFNLRVKETNSCIGVNLSLEEMQSHLKRMGLEPIIDKNMKNTESIKVKVPILRSDILHERDIIEDIAISYGYNNIKKSLPKCSTIGKPLPINKLADQLRQELAYSGFVEVLPLILCSKRDNYYNFNLEEEGNAVELLNPKTEECQIVRTHLLPGMLKTIQNNIKNPLPLKIFEISDVVVKDENSPNNVKNKRHICAIYCNKQSGFEIVHGLLNHIMKILDIDYLVDNNHKDDQKGYYIEQSTNKLYFNKRSADIYYNGKMIGSFGIINPNATLNFGIPFICSGIEFDIESFI